MLRKAGQRPQHLSLFSEIGTPSLSKAWSDHVTRIQPMEDKQQWWEWLLEADL
jgi:hypothetical protein